MPSPPAAEPPGGPAEIGASPAAGQSQPLLRRNLLKEWLANTAARILPQRPQRKIRPERLEDFFQLAQGSWFRVKDLAGYFAIDRKTAWEYLQKLQEAGLLVHNGARSAAVRYRLADHFLRIKLAALEQQVALALTDSPPPTAAQVAQALAATAGDPFWEEHWPVQMPAGRREEVSTSLKTAAILEVVYQSGRRRLLRLHRQWLKD
jgi:predicted transcriptional regulator